MFPQRFSAKRVNADARGSVLISRGADIRDGGWCFHDALRLFCLNAPQKLIDQRVKLVRSLHGEGMAGFLHHR